MTQNRLQWLLGEHSRADEVPEELCGHSRHQQGQWPVLQNALLVCLDHINHIMCETNIAPVVIFRFVWQICF